LSDALAGLKVLDVSTLFAGPLAATMLGDFGAEVIKVEHPRGDPVRSHGASKDGVGLWAKVVGRNKRGITLYLGSPEGQDVFRRLVADADVVIENFRPGTLERWGLGYPELSAINPRLVLTRVTGFGQIGPYAGRPGFGTLAEAMSGFAAITGQPDGPPTLPPFGLADGIAALAGAFATMTALRARDATGRGQVVDLAIIEPILTLLGPQPTVWDALHEVQERTGNRSANNAPRNTYLTRDDHWVAVSASATPVAARIMKLVGREDLANAEWFGHGNLRAEHPEVDDAVATWIAARDRAEVLREFEAAEASIAPVYSVDELIADPQVKHRGTFTRVEHPVLGPVLQQGPIFVMGETPGEVRFAGQELGESTDAILVDELGLDRDHVAQLKERGVVA